MSAQESQDQILRDALVVVRQEKFVSITLLQRRLRTNYPSAARILDEMEKRGWIGPRKDGEAKREILVDLFTQDQMRFGALPPTPPVEPAGESKITTSSDRIQPSGTELDVENATTSACPHCGCDIDFQTMIGCAKCKPVPAGESGTQQGPVEPFVDTPILAAKRAAFDHPTQGNLDALIAAATNDNNHLAQRLAASEKQRASESLQYSKNLALIAMRENDAQNALRADIAASEAALARALQERDEARERAEQLLSGHKQAEVCIFDLKAEVRQLSADNDALKRELTDSAETSAAKLREAEKEKNDWIEIVADKRELIERLTAELKEEKQAYRDADENFSRVVMEKVKLTAELSTLRQERDALAQWKREELATTADFQAIGKALGVQLGKSVSSEILPGIQRLTTERDDLAAKVAEAKANHESNLTVAIDEVTGHGGHTPSLWRIEEFLRACLTTLRGGKGDA